MAALELAATTLGPHCTWVCVCSVHVRRTDKVGTEAAFHHLHEYMRHAHDYYQQLQLTRAVDAKRVYLATDDAAVSFAFF